jgi:nicotinamidase-related amidase
MALSTIDPQTALVVVDLQEGITALPAAHPIDRVLAHASALRDAFHARGVPVVLVNVSGGSPGRAPPAHA